MLWLVENVSFEELSNLIPKPITRLGTLLCRGVNYDTRMKWLKLCDRAAINTGRCFLCLFAILFSTLHVEKVADRISFLFFITCVFILLFSSTQEGEIFQHEREFFWSTYDPWFNKSRKRGELLCWFLQYHSLQTFWVFMCCFSG